MKYLSQKLFSLMFDFFCSKTCRFDRFRFLDILVSCWWCSHPLTLRRRYSYTSQKNISLKNTFQKNISLNVHFPECTFGRMDISPKTYFPEWTLARMYIWPNGHFPENLFSRMNTCQNVHLAEWTFPRKFIFRNKITLILKSFFRKRILRKIIKTFIFFFWITNIDFLLPVNLIALL